MALADWVELGEGSGAESQLAVLEELGAMLDALGPVGLDRSRSRVVWPPTSQSLGGSTVQVMLEHVREADWTVVIHVSPADAVICWLSAHEHVDKHDAWGERGWTSVVIDAVAAVLRGEYEVEEVTRLGCWYKTRVIDVGDPTGTRVLDSSGPLWFWLLRPFPATTTRRRLNFTSP